MQITNSQILLTSQHQAVQQRTATERFRVWVGDQRPTNETTLTRTTTGDDPAYLVRLSQDVRGLSWPGQLKTKTAGLIGNKQTDVSPRSAKPAASPKTKAAEEAEEALAEAVELGDPELAVIRLLFTKMFNQEFRLFRLKTAAKEPEQAKQAEAAAHPPANDRQGWGIEYDYQESYTEAEQTSVTAAGIIKTADGQALQFKLEVTMSRKFMADHQVSLRLGDAATDPLVINFSGVAAQLTDTKFLFDLDADGGVEEMAFVSPGSSFLAIDRNQDGLVNDGRELFGPATGNGFSELAAYDQDGNDWLDENDVVFEELRLWAKDEQGNDQLFSLADKGIGALYLQPVSSEFSLKNSQNELQGQVRNSSLYVNESGSVGTMQQVDLVV